MNGNTNTPKSSILGNIGKQTFDAGKSAILEEVSEMGKIANEQITGIPRENIPQEETEYKEKVEVQDKKRLSQLEEELAMVRKQSQMSHQSYERRVDKEFNAGSQTDRPAQRSSGGLFNRVSAVIGRRRYGDTKAGQGKG